LLAQTPTATPIEAVPPSSTPVPSPSPSPSPSASASPARM
jgi:hypothetical protein